MQTSETVGLFEQSKLDIAAKELMNSLLLLIIVLMSGIPPVTAGVGVVGDIKFAIKAPCAAETLATSVISFSCNDIKDVYICLNVFHTYLKVFSF